MENGKGTNPLLVGVVVALVVGIAGGYYYGLSKGRTEALLLQQQEADQVTAGQQQQLADQANPFGTEENAVNPFTETYENPFEESGFNPFTQ